MTSTIPFPSPMTFPRRTRVLALVALSLTTLACGGAQTRSTSSAPEATEGGDAPATTTAPSTTGAAGIDATVDGHPYRLTYGYLVFRHDGTPVVFAASAPLDCTSLAEGPSGAPVVTADTTWYAAGYGDFAWDAGASADGIGIAGGIAGADGSLVSFNAPSGHVDVLTAPRETGGHGLVRMIAAADPDRSWLPTLNGEVDVEVCPTL